MSTINSMYKKTTSTLNSTNKNPNRVAGGLRAQGVDHYTIIDESGSERQIPSQKYVENLEEKIRMYEQRLSRLEKKMNQLTYSNNTLTNEISRSKNY